MANLFNRFLGISSRKEQVEQTQQEEENIARVKKRNQAQFLAPQQMMQMPTMHTIEVPGDLKPV